VCLVVPFYVVVFLEMAGFPATQAFNFSVGMTALGFFGTCCSFFLIPRFGRRTLYFGGLCVLTSIMLLIGFLGIAPDTDAMINAEAALLMVWFFVYFLTVGPVAYVIFSEVRLTSIKILYHFTNILYRHLQLVYEVIQLPSHLLLTRLSV
jgi:MFS transporter, SP family, general alpha glucoside:H+ symporter